MRGVEEPHGRDVAGVRDGRTRDVQVGREQSLPSDSNATGVLRVALASLAASNG